MTDDNSALEFEEFEQAAATVKPHLAIELPYTEATKLYSDVEFQVGDLLFPRAELWSQVTTDNRTGQSDEMFTLTVQGWEAERVKERLRSQAVIHIRFGGEVMESFSEYTWQQGARTWTPVSATEEIHITRELSRAGE